jgi:hypothetical protein
MNVWMGRRKNEWWGGECNQSTLYVYMKIVIMNPIEIEKSGIRKGRMKVWLWSKYSMWMYGNIFVKLMYDEKNSV